jgi:hypothetical protein
MGGAPPPTAISKLRLLELRTPLSARRVSPTSTNVKPGLEGWSFGSTRMALASRMRPPARLTEKLENEYPLMLMDPPARSSSSPHALPKLEPAQPARVTTASADSGAESAPTITAVAAIDRDRNRAMVLSGKR